jgi:hypothetical protein
MATYIRNLFGSSSQTTPVHGKAKTRSRTESTPGPSTFYIYTAPPTTPSTSTSRTSRPKVQRTTSYNSPSMVSSPLRYPTYDSRHSHEDSRPSPNRAANKPPTEMNGPLFFIPFTYIWSIENSHTVRGKTRPCHTTSAEWLRNSRQLAIKLYLFAVSWSRLRLRAISTGPESASFPDI